MFWRTLEAWFSCFVLSVKKDVFLSDGTVLPLPRGAYEPLNRAIIAHT